MHNDPYKNVAKFYDSFVEPSVAILRKMMLEMCLPQRGMRILEVGCGTGSNLKLYQEAECEIYGIDISPSMVKIARRKLGEQAHVKLGDASRMTYIDNQFDLVISMLTLHEICGASRSHVINEMLRVVKQDGCLLLIDYHTGPLRFPKGWLYKINILFFERIAGREHFKNYKDFIKSDGLQSLIKINNLTIEKKKILGGGNLALVCVKKKSHCWAEEG